MPELVAKFLQAFIPIFVAVDPIGLAAIFLALGSGVPADKRRRIANQAALTGGGVALLFLFLGASIFAAIGVTVKDFQIAGGLILFIIAARDLTQSAAEKPPELADDFGVVPLGMPLIAGPALITTLLLLAQRKDVGFPMTFVALAVNLILVVLAFACSATLGQKLGVTGMRAISKIVSMLLGAIAVSMIRQGLST
jgi:multiple antibiotic resistance protein